MAALTSRRSYKSCWRCLFSRRLESINKNITRQTALSFGSERSLSWNSQRVHCWRSIYIRPKWLSSRFSFKWLFSQHKIFSLVFFFSSFTIIFHHHQITFASTVGFFWGEMKNFLFLFLVNHFGKFWNFDLKSIDFRLKGTKTELRC